MAKDFVSWQAFVSQCSFIPQVSLSEGYLVTFKADRTCDSNSRIIQSSLENRAGTGSGYSCC
jgi:hypothetical protein